MAKDKGRQINTVNTGGGAYIGGKVNTGGGKFVGRDDYSQSGIESDEIDKLFNLIYAKIDSCAHLKRDDKADLKQEIEELRQELNKRGEADENFIMRRLRNIGRVAPDILEVTLATITNPIAGFGVIARKISEKAKSK